jgi:GNAT superfamily N-acetyltransferase
MTPGSIRIRTANADDIPALYRLIEASVHGLQAADYSDGQRHGALGNALGVDTQLIADRTYFIAEFPDDQAGSIMVGCGGWSYRKTLFGADGGSCRQAALLDPEIDAAKIRAIFVHPDRARQGIGSLLLNHCEEAARAAGFYRFEMGSTLTGVALYILKGYKEVERIDVPLPNGEVLPVVKMSKP